MSTPERATFEVIAIATSAGGLKALQDLSRSAGGKTLLLTRQLGVK